jgi:hypothetical protein
MHISSSGLSSQIPSACVISLRQARSMLPATEWYIVGGDIWNKKTSVNHLPGKAETTPKQFLKLKSYLGT